MTKKLPEIKVTVENEPSLENIKNLAEYVKKLVL